MAKGSFAFPKNLLAQNKSGVLNAVSSATGFPGSTWAR